MATLRGEKNRRNREVGNVVLAKASPADASWVFIRIEVPGR
jgi:hypothetical protein